MDYQQSIKNLNHLKNFARAWTECHIFFFYYSETEYRVEIYNSDFTDAEQENIDQNLRKTWPYAFICNEKCGQEILYYSDKNITIRYNLFSDTVNDFFYMGRVDKKESQKQFLRLINILKNK